MNRVSFFDLDPVPKSKQEWTKSASIYKNVVNRRYVKVDKDEMKHMVRCARCSDGDKREYYISKIVDAMGPLIMKLALKFSSSFDYMDYVQEGAMAVMTSIDKFDIAHKSGSSFVTYCVTAILARYNMITCEWKHIVRNPSITATELKAFRKFCTEHSISTGALPDEYDIKEYCKLHKIPYIKGMEYGSVYETIDKPHEDGYVSVMDEIDITTGQNFMPDRWVEDYDNLEWVHVVAKNFIDRMSRNKTQQSDKFERDIDILFDYYGIDGREPMTIYELSIKYDTSETRVSQILKSTPAKIRKCWNNIDLTEI